MIYSEAAYFDGYAFAHIAAWVDHTQRSAARKHFVRTRHANMG